jgi:integrase
MVNPIRKTKTLAGTIVWQVDGRRFNAVPARPQFATKEQAEAALADMIATRGAGLNPSRRDITFQMQADSYLRHKTKLARKTRGNIESYLRNHLLPAFGPKRVTEIASPRLIKDFLAEKETGGAGPGAVKKMRATLSVIFGSAVEDGLIAANPVLAIGRKDNSRQARVERDVAVAKERVLTKKQIDAILGWCETNDPDLGVFVLTLLRTGARPGEARALRWGDVIDDKILIEKGADDQNEMTLTKTGGKRAVDLTPALKDVLRLRWLKAGEPTGEHFVFGNGVPIPVRKLSARWLRCLREVEIVGHVMYDCRHTYASQLLNNGANILYVAKMLGHKDATTTLRYYAHYMETESVRFADKLDDQPATDTVVEVEAARA